MSDVMNELKHSLSGDHEHKPKKEIHKMHIEKAKSGGHIITHEHTHPSHPDEKHVTKNMSELHDHLESAMGTPNPGEAQADAGQSGIPDAQASAAGIPAGEGAAPGAAPGGAPSPVMG